jgi:hypothetical protein
MYTSLVRQLVAFVLVVGVVLTATRSAELHIHRYPDHDHPEHHHGLALHDHHFASGKPSVPGGGARVERCDPAGHVTSVVFLCTAAAGAETDAARLEIPLTDEPDVHGGFTVDVAGIRVHGPPGTTRTSPRAPPLNALT